MMSLFFRKYTISVLFIISLILIGCAARKADPNFGIITFAAGDVKINNVRAETGAKMQMNDTLSTGENSIAVVQFSEAAVITIKEASSLKLEQIVILENNTDTLKLFQSSGSTFNKIVKKGTDYQIKTPTTVAAIRGTSFELSSGSIGDSLLVLTGKVTVAPLNKNVMDSGKSIQLDEGKKVQVSGGVVEKPVAFTDGESASLKKYDKIEVVKGLDKILLDGEKNRDAAREKMSIMAVPSEVREVIIEKRDDKKKDDKSRIEEKPKTSLNDLKKKYGTLTVVKTKDGKEYIGAFTQKDNIVEIITVDGLVTVNGDNVQNISKNKQ